MLSIVIPIYNEEKTLPILYQRLTSVMAKIKTPYEVIFVDDGSKDNSMNLMLNMNKNDSRIKILKLSRNFGHQTAISAGINQAGGEAVILMDGDLQDPPEVMLEFIKKWKEGWDVVYGIKKKRKENIIKRLLFSLFYRIIGLISEIKLPIDAGTFSIMDKKVVRILQSMPERNKYISGLRTWSGFKQTGIVYERGARFSGKPRQSLSKLFKLAFDGIFSFSSVPLKVFTYFGFLIAILSSIAAIVILCIKLFTDKAISGWASTMVAIFFLGSVQLLSVGIVGQYIARIYEEVKSRPYYVVEQKIGFD